jgi:hypothetical protein
MRNQWSGLGLLLVVPWLVNCVSGPVVRLDTGEGAPIVYTPPAAEPPPVELHQEEFLDALVELMLSTPLTLRPRPQEGQVVLASWGGSQDRAQDMLLNLCPPEESPQGCLTLPENAPPPETLARLRLALSFSMDTLWEGATVAIAEFVDPLAFKVMVYTAMTTYLVTLMVPEPVTKGLAAALTLYLVAYLGFGPFWSLLKAGHQLLEDSRQATTSAELKQAGQRFGRVLGENGMRVFLLLATAALAGQTNFTAKGPRLPGFRRAAQASPTRTGVRLPEVGQVSTVAVGANTLTVALAPAAVATTAMSTRAPVPGATFMANQGAQGAARPAPSRYRLQRVEPWRKPRFTEDGRILPYPGSRQPPNPIVNLGRNRAGQTVTDGKNSLRFDKEGFPELETRFETIIDDVHIGSGNRTAHSQAANKKLHQALQKDPALAKELGLSSADIEQLPTLTRAPEGYTWHHHQDVCRMQLVSSETHLLANPHTGGMAIWGGGS